PADRAHVSGACTRSYDTEHQLPRRGTKAENQKQAIEIIGAPKTFLSRWSQVRLLPGALTYVRDPGTTRGSSVAGAPSGTATPLCCSGGTAAEARWNGFFGFALRGRSG